MNKSYFNNKIFRVQNLRRKIYKMKSKKLFLILISFALILTSAQNLFASIPANPIVPIVKKASPAVVNIDVEARAKRTMTPFPFDDDPIFKRFFGDAFKEFNRSVPMKGRGSGFIVTKDGQILTNNHVINGAEKITVSVQLANGNKKTYPAKVLGKDPNYDIAIIKINADEDLPVLELGDSEKVEVGEYVVAIGNPFGFEQTVTAGVISAKNRSVHAQDVNFDDFLQTDAAINPGNSGGPLLNMEGKVIGINTAIVPYAQGIGFAIPINKAKGRVMEDLISYGHVKRGWLGVSIMNLDPDVAKIYGAKDQSGVIVAKILPDTPAERAGLKKGDIITEVNGEKVKDASHFTSKISSFAPNSNINLGVIRRGSKINFKIKLNERPASADGIEEDEINNSDDSEIKSNDALKDFGINGLADLNSNLRRRYKLDENISGVIITEIERGSSAYMNGLKNGDLLREINGQEINNVNGINKLFKKTDDMLILTVERDGNTIWMKVDKNK